MDCLWRPDRDTAGSYDEWGADGEWRVGNGDWRIGNPSEASEACAGAKPGIEEVVTVP